jgi:ATP-dependent RNA helicase DHX57
MVDEVHERHLDTDIVLGLLKHILPQNPHLSLVLMSATMDADRLAAYWGPNTPRMEIPGRTFPVKDYTLEHVLSLIRFVPSKKGKKPSLSTVETFGDDAIGDEPFSDEHDEPDVREESINGVPVAELVKRVDESSIPYEILARLVKHLVEVKPSGDDGSILVFLPGAPEIAKAAEEIERLAQNLPCYILPLHGGLQPKEQSKVFLPAAYGKTKIVLATNICQTSVTIPDCTIVIDTAKEKQSSYDPANRMPLLVEKFASKADLKQRRGRAGRVRSGVCYKLVSNATISRLREHGEPEILRCALDQTLLSILYMGVEDGTGNFLKTLLDPPTKASVDAAACNLEKIGAVGPREIDGVLKLTPLGTHLAGIPAPPSVGKSKWNESFRGGSSLRHRYLNELCPSAGNGDDPRVSLGFYCYGCRNEHRPCTLAAHRGCKAPKKRRGIQCGRGREATGGA